MANINNADPWLVQPRERQRYEEQFRSLRPINGIITGDQAKGFLLQSQLPPPVLGQIWSLADTDSDGKMNIEEFSIACKLINLKLRNFELPKTLPPTLLQSIGSGVAQIRPKPPTQIPLVGLAQPLAGQPPGRPAAPPVIPPLPHPALLQHQQPSPVYQQQVQPPPAQMYPAVAPVAQMFPAQVAPVAQMHPVVSPPSVQPQLPIRPPSVPPVERVASIESPLSHGGQLLEWAVPHANKLRYTQLFNSMDRSRSGYLSGHQARSVMVQSQVAQPILAQIWALSDMDADGRLSCEEFVLALHLCEMAKNGEKVPAVLPADLVPPTMRRQSLTGSTPGAVGDLIDKDAALSLLTTTFEDKRKENFDKGQAELERRRKTLLEIQRKEQEERQRKEKDEEEKRERVRLEQERRRQLEFEKQLQRQREAEQEKEEQRKRAVEQKESARKEMERQRRLEWEKSRSQELQLQRQREQETVLKLKARNQTLGIELSQLNDKVKELSGCISETRLGVSAVKTTIDGMRSTRDTQLADMASLKTRLKEQNQRLVSLSQEKNRMETKNKMNLAQDSVNQEQAQVTFSNKQITLKQMRDRLGDLQQEIEVKLADIENNNSQLGDLKQQLGSLIAECEKLYTVYEDRRSKVLEIKSAAARVDPTDFSASWGSAPVADPWPTSVPSVDEAVWPVEADPEPVPSADFAKYRALYEFVARNGDEISFQPGDIIMVPLVHNAEPGWLAGQIRGHTGWFPESYVEPVDTPTSAAAPPTFTDAFADAATFPADADKRQQLEEIAEVPENVSDNGSMAEMAGVTGAQLVNEIVKLAESTVAAGGEPQAHGYYVALYPYASPEVGDLGFGQGEVILVIKKDGDWWTGVIGDRQGIFPSNYVQPAATSEPEVEVAVEAEPPQDFEPIVEEMEESVEISQPMEVEEVLTTQTAPVAAVAVAQSEPVVQAAVAPVAQQEPQPEEPQPVVKSPATPDFAAMNASTLGKSRKPEIATVIAPYQATSTEQLSLARGQLVMIRKKTTTGWWEGELQAKGRKRQVGWFPASYVKALSSGRNTPVSLEQTNRPDTPELCTQEKVIALFPYTALNGDELSFDKDDVIVLVAREEEAWWRGELNGAQGMFPSNYVAAI